MSLNLILNGFYSFSGLFSSKAPTEEAERFQEAMEDPLKLLDALQGGEDPHLTEEHLFEVALACALKDVRETAECIQKFGFNEEKRFELALACARQDVLRTGESIQNFDLNEEKRLKVALACLCRDGGTVKYIQNFDLNEEKRLKVALACACQYGWETVYYIQNFGFNEENRLKVALACAQHAPYYMTLHIQNFGLNEENRFKVALACACRYGEGTVECIQNFGLNEENRFKMALVCAQQAARETAAYIKNFGLTEEELFKVALACVYENAWETTYYIGRFGLNEEQEFEIFILAFLQTPRSLENLPSAGQSFRSILYDLRNGPSLLEIIDRLFALPTPGLNTETCASMLKKIEEPGQQKEFIALAAFALFLWTKAFTKEQLEWVSRQKFLDEIFSLRAPYLRVKLIKLVKEIGEPSLFEQFPNKWPQLLKLPLAKLAGQGVDLSSLKISEHALRDSAVLIPLLEAMIELADDEVLSPAQKTAIIEAMSQKPLDLACELLMILNFHRSDLLQTGLDRGLSVLAEEAFRSVLPLPEAVDDFLNRYQNTFGSYREKNGFRIYAANLNKQSKYRRALESLGAHFFSILNGTYIGERYDPAKNPHLQALQQHRPGILDDWKQNSAQPLQEVFASGPAPAAAHSMRQWLYEKLIDDGHLGKLDENDFLSVFLREEGDPEQEKKNLFEERKALAKQPLSSEDREKRLTEINLRLKCYELAKSSDVKNSLRLLREIELCVKPSEFKNDIAAKIASLTRNQSLADFTIVETDDPQDLFSCGTEIRGSCQRFDGDPSLNRGLVGYLRNGQTRMIAIKDKTHRLVARCLLRLLVNEEGKPVLFLERFYSNIDDPSLYLAIVAKAKQTADRLLCPLTSLESWTGCRGPIRSLGGVAPWEYVDGTGNGIEEGGVYMIKEAGLIYDPLL